MDHVICWSATWHRQSWRLSATNNTFRATVATQSDQGHVTLATQSFTAPAPAWDWLAGAWIADSTRLYDAVERRFRADFCSFRDGRRGFRPGSRALRTRAEVARDDLFTLARWAGRTWPDLQQAAGALTGITTPEWLANAVEDTVSNPDVVPDLEHWLHPRSRASAANGGHG